MICTGSTFSDCSGSDSLRPRTVHSGIFQSDSSLFWRETTRHAELVVQFQGFASLPLYSSMNSESGFSIRLMESQSPLRTQQASNGILCVEPTNRIWAGCCELPRGSRERSTKQTSRKREGGNPCRTGSPERLPRRPSKSEPSDRIMPMERRRKASRDLPSIRIWSTRARSRRPSSAPRCRPDRRNRRPCR